MCRHEAIYQGADWHKYLHKMVCQCCGVGGEQHLFPCDGSGQSQTSLSEKWKGGRNISDGVVVRADNLLWMVKRVGYFVVGMSRYRCHTIQHFIYRLTHKGKGQLANTN